MYQKSLTVICEAADLIESNLALQYSPTSLTDATLADRGPTNITVPLSATGLAPATHYGAHYYDDNLLTLLEDAPTKASLFPTLSFYAVGGGETPTPAAFYSYIATINLQRIMPPEEPEE